MLTTLSNFRRALVFGLAATALLSACSDSTAPTARRSGFITAATNEVSLAVREDGELDLKLLYPKSKQKSSSRKEKNDTTYDKFTVKAGEASIVKFGKRNGHQIAIPADIICDPATSGYGPSEWLKPCTPATEDIEFSVVSWPDAQGRTHVEFSPDVRFDPSAELPVRIFFNEETLQDFSQVIIPFCSTPSTCIDESIGDPALTTYYAAAKKGGYYVYRMLRHFSGYNVTAF